MTLRATLVTTVLMGLASLSGRAGAADPNHSDALLNLSLEELMKVEVRSASFFTTTTTKAPGYVMVYDMNEISEGPTRTLADLMELYVPGAVVGGHERQGRLLGIRGLEIDNNAKTVVMWDGQQINYRAHFGYMVGLLSPFMGDISKIEVIHGPGAIQHGSGAINGFINMVPKTGSSHPGGYAHYEYGAMEQSNLLEGGYGVRYGENRDLYAYAGVYGAKGFEPDDLYGGTQNYAGPIQAFGYDDKNYRFSATWNHDDLNVEWFVYTLSPRKNSANEDGSFMNEAMGVRPRYTMELSPTDCIEWNTSLQWMDYGTTGHNGQAFMKGGSEDHWEVKPIFKTTRLSRQQLAVGVLYGYKGFRTQDMYFHSRAQGGIESLNTHWTEESVFGEDILSLTDRLTLSLGLRYDKVDTSPMSGFNWNDLSASYTPEQMAGHTSPRVAFAYEVDKATNVKGSYQHGFRMPDAAYYTWNVYNNSVAQGLGYPTFPLKPETMDSWELDLQKILTPRVEAGLNLFYNTFTDQLSWGPLSNCWTAAQVTEIDKTSIAPWGMFQNIRGSFNIWGTEALLKVKVTDATDVGASYGYVKCVNNEIEQHYPPNQVKLNVTSRFLDNRFIVGLNYVYNSAYSREINPVISPVYEHTRNWVDLSAAYHVSRQFKIKAAIQNLLGEHTPGSGGFLMGVPSKYALGYDEPRVYISGELTF
jgi:outer membrane receptor for ferrienterochelin and colicin